MILLSGDRHFTGGYQINQRVMEITSGPLGSNNYPTPNLPEMFLNHGVGKLYCVFDVDTRSEVPQVILEVHRAGEGLIDRRDFTMDEINGKARLATLPVRKVSQQPPYESDLPLVHREDFEKGAEAWIPTDSAAWTCGRHKERTTKRPRLHRRVEVMDMKEPYHDRNPLTILKHGYLVQRQ